MKNNKRFLSYFNYRNLLCSLFIIHSSLFICATAQAARARVQPAGIYDAECYDAYYGCMDQFCMPADGRGGACMCDDKFAALEKDWIAADKKISDADDMKTIDVAKINAGANADIVFGGGERKYDANGNVIYDDDTAAATQKAAGRVSLAQMLRTPLASFSDEDNIINQAGSALYASASEMCAARMPAKCADDAAFLRQMYLTQVRADCTIFESEVAAHQKDASAQMLDAQNAVRDAYSESFASANRLDRGQCMVAFRKCMQGADACGADWAGCVSTIASENMQNLTKRTVKTTDVISITPSTLEMLSAKRNICESVLGECMASRDYVWTDFLREAAPQLKLAELNAESKMRGSCLTDIADCMTVACRDDIAGRGVATMDACLSRPEMARSFCKNQIDTCERMEPLIWGYVKDKLAAMRVDVCTNEVRDCFTADTRCGSDFSRCIGMDYKYIHDICPIDALPVCKANNPKFSMDDLDTMLMGLYLNIDNAALDQCQNLVAAKMTEVCGSTVDCNVFAADDTIGTGSLRAQKDGNIYRITGMISFGSIKMGDSAGTVKDVNRVLKPGEIGVADYIEKVMENNSPFTGSAEVITTIEAELQNIAGTINRVINMIESDPEIGFCVSGRDLSQITGTRGQSTTGRFPNLLNPIKTQIAVAALRKANDNYNAKLTTEIAAATKNASADLAQYMCQRIAHDGARGLDMSMQSDDLMPPYAISYEVGSGLTNAALTQGGQGVIKAGGATFKNSKYLGGNSLEMDSAMTKETTAIFNRDTRVCHICHTISTQSCKTTGSSSWFHNNRKVDCQTDTQPQKCEDISM